MKKFFKVCSFMIVLLLALICSSCKDNPSNLDDNPGTTNPDNQGGTTTPEKTLESISVSGGKKEFKVGDTFDKSGLVVIAKYSDNTEEDVTSKATVSNPDMTQEGNKRVTVTYEGKTTDYTITVTSDATIEDPNKISYEVSVKAINGKALDLVLVSFYLDGKEVSYKTTTDDGIATFRLNPNEYDVYIEPELGYTPKQDAYKVSQENSSLEVICDMKLVESNAPTGHKYTSGDIMYDFTITNTKGETVNLKTLLETKELIVLNFWYTTCSWCVREFPLLENAYQKYKDDVAVIALDYQDGLQDIIAFQENYGLTFDVARDEIGLTTMFPVSGFPTSIFIDRNGAISIIESGAITSQEKWDGIFEEFIGDSYVPTYTPSGAAGEEKPIERPKPTISMPDSSVLEAVANGTNFDGVYSPEQGENDKDYSWPWIVSEDGTSIIPSNAGVNNSFATVYIKVNFEYEKAFTFDYFSSTESSDILYILVNRALVARISGCSTDWETCTPYVSLEAGEHEIVFLYLKDNSAAGGDDVVYIKNLHFISKEEITSPLYMERECSSGDIIGTGEDRRYTNYITPVFNSEDGFYHVNKVDGPLVLADLLSTTHWSEKTIFEYAQAKELIINEKEYNTLITYYSSIANNSTVGYVPVNKELFEVLNLIANTLGEANYAEQWLEICVYFSAYGTNGEELADPIKGLAPFDSYIAQEGDQNFLEVDRTIMPKGQYFRFIPSKSGVYKVNSIGDAPTQCWLYDENNINLCVNDEGLRYYAIEATNDSEGAGDPNFQLYYYLEEGKTYYIAVCFEDPEYINATLQFNVEYIGEEHTVFTVCSPGWFTTDGDELSGPVISKGIKAELQEDGYYHQVENENVGSVIYADFMYLTNIFSLSLQDLIDKGAFNFSVNENGEAITDGGEDCTEEIKEYLNQMEMSGEEFGCIKVDERLAEILQMLMDKYTFKGVKDSWLKLCYYFKTIDENTQPSGVEQ